MGKARVEERHEAEKSPICLFIGIGNLKAVNLYEAFLFLAIYTSVSVNGVALESPLLKGDIS